MTTNSIDYRKAHLTTLKKASADLNDLANSMRADGKPCDDLIILAQTTLTLMCGVANALVVQSADLPQPVQLPLELFIITFDTDSSWENAVTALHRYFFSNLGSVVESELEKYIRLAGREPVICRNLPIDKLMNDPEMPKKFRSKLRRMISKRAEAGDLLNTALDIAKFDEQKTAWIKQYFESFRIIRNKASHGKSDYSDHELKTLRKDAKFNALMVDGDFRPSVEIYPFFILHMWGFVMQLNNALEAQRTHLA